MTKKIEKDSNINYIIGFVFGLIFNVWGFFLASNISEKASKGAIAGILSIFAIAILIVFITRLIHLF